jgi:hypothetical protein
MKCGFIYLDEDEAELFELCESHKHQILKVVFAEPAIDNEFKI